MADDRPITLHEAALRAGTLMGLYWTVKFAFIPLGFTMPTLHLLFIVCTLAVPVLGYIYARRYRDRHRGGAISGVAGMTFCILMYLSATMLAFIAHYVYFEYMDGGYLITAYQAYIDAASDLLTGKYKASMDALMEQVKPALEQLSQMSPLDITFGMASQDLTWCFILSVLTGLGIYRKEKPTIDR